MGNIAEYNAQVPDNIKRIINEKCMMQYKVAARAGYTKQAFCDMTQNRKLIKPVDINNISQALGVPVEELFRTK